MIGGAKGIGLGIDLGLVNQYNRTGIQSYIEPEVLDSLVGVWSAYGMTNDSPNRSTIKNKLSNRGGDFVISNAAFKLNSGFGKYGMDFLEWKSNSGMNITSTKLTSTKPNLSGGWLTFRSVSGLISETKVKVSGAPREFGFIGNNNGTDDKFSVTINNGVYTIPEFTLSSASGFYINNNSGDWSNLVIEQIPSFEGAFVTDGVNDLITSTKTVQEMLGGSNEITVVSMIHLIDINHTAGVGFTNYVRVGSSFIRSQSKVNDKTGIYGWTYSNSGNVGTINNILGDKNDYATSDLSLPLDSKFSVEGYSHSSGIAEICQVAWYWTIIANKVLTTDQINQVIAYFNLDRTLNPDILCNTIKQGITNENHAEFGDKLIDYSGNGRDIQLNNIAWKGDSGIGKYAADFTDTVYNKWFSTYNSFSIEFFKNNQRWRLSTDTTKRTFPSMKVSVKGIMDGDLVQYHYYDGSAMKYLTLNNGENTIPDSKLESGEINHLTGFWANVQSDTKITITQIPSHSGALCLNGVDDFGKVTGMPIYKDYTVVTDREIFANTGAISSKNNPGAFVETDGNSVYSFGQATSGLNFISTRSISYLSKYSYCRQSITAGAAEDGTDMWLGTIRDNDSRFFNGAIYSLMSFPYSMSEFLIERQLKKHKLGTLYPDMVEFRPIVKSNLPYSSISYSVNPGEYISVDIMVTITVTLPNTSDKLMEVSCNAISDISISGDNGVYEITGKIVKSPQKINIVISSYLTMLSNSTLISNETLIKNE